MKLTGKGIGSRHGQKQVGSDPPAVGLGQPLLFMTVKSQWNWRRKSSPCHRRCTVLGLHGKVNAGF